MGSKVDNEDLGKKHRELLFIFLVIKSVVLLMNIQCVGNS